MYLEHFNLREYPFQLTPDSDYLYMSKSHARAKAYMDYTIWNRDGFVVITGEVGAGKTTLIQKFLSELHEEDVLVAKIFQTQLNEVEFLQSVLNEFGLKPGNASKVELLDMLNTFLLNSFVHSKQLVLIVDEAQNLSNRVLEEIRMLSGLETRKEKILHVILVGQPELKERLESSELDQLLQRVRLRFHLRALNEVEIKDYILHRLRIAGAKSDGIFADNTFSVIYQYTGGIPRLINTLCDTALTVAYADDCEKISVEVIKTAIEELQWQPYNKKAKARAALKNPYDETKLALPQLLHDSRQTLQILGEKLNHLDSLPPALMVISDRMMKIETQLRRIADYLANQNPGDNVQFFRKNNK